MKTPVNYSLIALALLALSTFNSQLSTANASVTNVVWYRLGENDPGAANSVAATNTTDLMGFENLQQFGSPLYTNSVSTGASNNVGSSLALQFNGSQSLSNGIVSTATISVGIEAWVKPDNTGAGNRVIAYNGNTGANGWGIIQNGTNYFAMLGGVTTFGMVPAVAGTWTHLALVCSFNVINVNNFYINGVSSNLVNFSSPIAPSGGFAIGAAPQAPNTQNFIGTIDEVRVFKFTGIFSSSDLLVNLQRVTTQPATLITSAGAQLNGLVNPAGMTTAAWFEWGATTNYGNVTAAQLFSASAGNTNFSQVITGLLGGVTYNFRADASNLVGVVVGANQSFTVPLFYDIQAGLPGICSGAAAWGDCNNDGRLDILLTGYNTAAPNGYTSVWTNTMTGFSITFGVSGGLGQGTPLGVFYSSGGWGDVDNDGWLDFAVSGKNVVILDQNTYITVAHNNTGTFHDLQDVDQSYAAVSGSVQWGDFNNDSRLDLLVSGNGFAAAVNNINSVFPYTGYLTNMLGDGTSAAWGDYDNDGRLDAMVGGQIWRNTGSGFSNINFGLPLVTSASVAWGDYDNDGRLDILLTGTTNGLASGAITQVWRNTGTGFTNINAGLPGVFSGSVAWGDYDNDGRLDILLSGFDTNHNPITQVWRNTGTGFTNINAGLPGVGYSSVAWGDFDNDGRLDILLAGTNGTGNITQVWRNNATVTNTPPLAPGGLMATGNDAGVTFQWSTAGDAQTPSSSLAYNLRVGLNPGGGEIVGPMAAGNGFRRVPQLGNAQMNLFRTISGLPLGQTIYWSVQAIDTAFAGSPWAPEQSFKLLKWDAPVILTSPSLTMIPVGDYNGNGVIDESDLATFLANLNGNGIVNQAELDLVLSNYFPYSPWLYMTNVAGLGGTNVTFALSNSIAGAFSVEYSTNLTDWQFLGPATPRYLFNDTNAPAGPQRYYRLRWP